MSVFKGLLCALATSGARFCSFSQCILRRHVWQVGIVVSTMSLIVLATSNLPAAPLPTPIAKIFDAGSPYPMGYQLFTPPGYTKSGLEYPLILALHGSGERGTDNKQQIANIPALISVTQQDPYKAFVLAPQLTDVPGAGGWNPNGPFDRTIEILNSVLADFPVDVNRIYITGLSMGGFGTFDYIAAYPHLFAAAAPMAGGGDPSTASIIKDIPIWVFHGDADPTVPVEYSREMVAAITAAGGHPKYTEFPGVGHPSWLPVYGEFLLGTEIGFYDWMFAQHKVVPEPATGVLAMCGFAAATLAGLHGRRRRPNCR
jgi:predicted esterase